MSLKGKRGFMGDHLIYILGLFLFSVSILVIYYAVIQINTGWQAANIPAESKTLFGDFKERFGPVYDRVFVLLVIGYFIVMAVVAYALRSSPALAFISLVVMLIFGGVSVHLANAYFSLASDPTFAAAAGGFSLTTFLMSKLPHLALVAGFIFIIILFSKSQEGASL